MIIQKNLIITTFICLLLLLAIYLRFSHKKKQELKTGITRNNAMIVKNDIANQLVSSNLSGSLSTIPNIIMTGAIAPFAVKNTNSPPDGWLICDGRQYKIADYQALSDKISSVNGISTDKLFFNTPNLKNMFIKGIDSRSQTPPIGGTQEDSFKAHSHNITSTPHAHGGINIQPLFGGTGQYGGSNWNQTYTDAGTQGSTSNIKILGTYKGSTPGVKDFDDETRPVNMCLLYCIKT